MPADSFYASPAWRDLRRAFLRDNPTCSVAGCGKRSGHADHRLSRRKRPDLALDRSNLVPYCHGHHSAKTAAVDGGFGNAGGGVFRPRGCDADGNPVDPGHRWAR